MTHTLVHRGPDGSGFFVSDGIELGMRRLAIIDVAHGHQPAQDESGNIRVIFNGEIYNFRELRHTLEKRGHSFATGSDTEVIAHLYEDEGTDCFDRMRGMFAIAIWDARHRSLILARDPLGKKPLFYCEDTSDHVMFASEARALISGGLDPQPNFSSLNHVLAFGYSPICDSAFLGVKSVPPGTWMRWQNRVCDSHRYWHVTLDRKESWSEQEAIGRVEEGLDVAVTRRLLSERAIGSFLSGGIDSTVVTALMARHSSEPVKTFTVAFDDAAYNEAKHAQAIADYLGTAHSVLMVRPDPLIIIEQLRNAFDQPFADSSAIPTMLLSEFASQHVVVALGGDGGDETFGGYDRYRATEVLQRLNTVWKVFGPTQSLLARAARATKSRRWIRLQGQMHPVSDLAHRYLEIMLLMPRAARASVWTEDARRSMDLAQPENSFLDLWSRVRADTDRERMVGQDFDSYLPGDLLVKADISSMASSLELRSPLLDRDLIDIAARIPTRVRFGGGEGKHILKVIARKLVPAELVDRPKMGFAIPRAQWLRGPLREISWDLLTDSTARDRNWFSQDAVRKLLVTHDSGVDTDAMLWPMLMIETWARGWLRSP